MELIAAVLLAGPLGYFGGTRKRVILTLGIGINRLGRALRERRAAKRHLAAELT
jgi:hypothetical protein